MPLSLRQGISLADPGGLQRLYARIAEVLECRAPLRDFDALTAALNDWTAQIPLPAGEPEDAHRELRRRFQDALNHPKHKWRTLSKLAVIGLVTEDAAAEILRLDRAVRFSRNPDGAIIVGLISRVGPG
jgi:hypothetical protein